MVNPERQIYRDAEDGGVIRGIGLPAFIKNGSYFSTVIGVYEDGVIWSWGWTDFDGLVKEVEKGRVVTSAPPDAEIVRHQSFRGVATGLRFHVEEAEFIKEVRDKLNVLKGQPSSHHLCRSAFREYASDATPMNRTRLAEAYEAVPKHLRPHLGQQGDQDLAFLRALSGDATAAELKKWADDLS